MTVKISSLLCAVQAEIDRLEGIDAGAARADYILNAAEDNTEHLWKGPVL